METNYLITKYPIVPFIFSYDVLNHTLDPQSSANPFKNLLKSEQLRQLYLL